MSNKLEAQFNFLTLTAGWYGDEENILLINLFLETPESFIEQKHRHCLNNIYDFADDVFSYDHKKEENEQYQIFCFIAFTESELKLLSEQNKLLSGFIQAKIHKVLNLIAGKRKLFPI